MVLVVQFIFYLKSCTRSMGWPHAHIPGRQQVSVVLGGLSVCPRWGTSGQLLGTAPSAASAPALTLRAVPPGLPPAPGLQLCMPMSLRSHSPRPVLTGPLGVAARQAGRSNTLNAVLGRGMEWRGRAFCLPSSQRIKLNCSIKWELALMDINPHSFRAWI